MNKKKMTTSALTALVLTLVLATTSQPSEGENLPPIRMVVSLPAGGGVDAMARIVAQRFSETSGRNVVVENKPGASGTIAAKAVINAPVTMPTILASGNQEVTIAPALLADSDYHPLQDLKALVQVGTVASVLFAKANTEWASPEAFVSSLRQKSAIGVGIPGVGTPMHLSLAAIAAETGREFLTVPYKGAPDVIRGVLAGDTPYGAVGLPAVLPFLQSGQATPIAILGPDESVNLPGVKSIGAYIPTRTSIPTISYGFLAPASLPTATLVELESAITAAINDNNIRTRLAGLGIEGKVANSTEYAASLKQQSAYYTHALTDSRIK